MTYNVKMIYKKPVGGTDYYEDPLDYEYDYEVDMVIESEPEDIIDLIKEEINRNEEGYRILVKINGKDTFMIDLGEEGYIYKETYF